MDAAIQYVRTDDGVDLAYCTVGKGPPTLLLRPISSTHLGLEGRVPSFDAAHEEIAQDLTLIRLDPRATGLSSPSPDISADAFVRDIHTVLTTTKSDPVAIISVTEPWRAVRFAAAHPGLVSCLVVLSPEIDPMRRKNVARAVWESAPDVAQERLQSLVNPSIRADDQEAIAVVSRRNRERWDRLGVNERFLELELQDVEESLPAISCPTLVVHYSGRGFSDGAKAARLIPDATLVVREGVNGPFLNYDLPALFALLRGFIHAHAGAVTERRDAAAGPDAPETADTSRVSVTPRELEVLRLVSMGRTDLEIADALVVQPSTISRHVHNILRKTNSRNRTEAVTWGFMRQILRD